MGRLLKKETSLDRRLKRLQQQQDLVRRDIKSLSRALRNPEDLSDLPRLKSATPIPPRPEGRSERAGRTPAAPALADEENSLETGPESARGRSHPVASDSRFTNYFTVDRASGLRPLRQEKSVQRNKAIFMIVMVIIAAFVVYRLMS